MLESRMKHGLNAEIIAPLALSLSPPGGERVSGRTGLRRAEAAPSTQAGEGIVFGFSSLFFLGIVGDDVR